MKIIKFVSFVLFISGCSVAGSTPDEIIRRPKLDVGVEIVVNSRKQNVIKTTEVLIYGEKVYNKNKEVLNLSSARQVINCLKKYERCLILVDLKNDGTINKTCIFPVLSGKVLVAKDRNNNIHYEIGRSFFISYLLGEIDIMWDKWPQIAKGLE